MSSNPGQEGVLAHDEHAEHGDAGIRNSSSAMSLRACTAD